MSVPNPSSNTGCLGILHQIYHSIHDTLFGAGPAQNSYVAGFSIDQLYDYDIANDHKNSLLHILHCNFQKAQENLLAKNAAKVPLGWFFILPKSISGTVARKDLQVTPNAIRQLVLHISQDMARSPEENCPHLTISSGTASGTNSLALYFTLEPVNQYLFNVSGSSLFPISYMHHAIFPDAGQGAGYHNFVERDSMNFPQDRNLTLGDLEYFKEQTDLVYFSSTQLLMIKRLLDSYRSQAKNVKTIFSGYDMFIGRMSNRMNAAELEQMAAGSGRNPIHCFTLKAEIIDEQRLVVNAENQSSNRYSDPWAKIETDPNAELPFPSGAACQVLSQNGIPAAWFGNPCPPVWEPMGEILNTMRILDSSIDPQDVACAYYSAIYEGTMPAEIGDAAKVP